MRKIPANPLRHGIVIFLLLVLPSWGMAYEWLVRAESFLSVSQDQALSLSLYFLAGMALSALLALIGFRFLLPFAAVLIGHYLFSQGLDALARSEFDIFFLSLRFQVFALLFTLGWIMGWGWVRWRHWAVVVSLCLLAVSMFTLMKTQEPQLEAFLRAFLPSLFFSAYFLFASHQIEIARTRTRGYWSFLLRRHLGFTLVLLLLLGGLSLIMEEEIKDRLEQIGGGGEQGDNSMLERNEDGSFDLKEYSRLRSSLGRSNELLFCARIDHFFEGTDIPNPLYLTAFYYTYFDTLTETFERDPSIPDQDLYSPDPSSIPLYSTEADSNVLATAANDRLRKEIEVEIYGKLLSPKTYLAPHIGYWVQPITIEEEYRSEFRWAYRSKGYASELNSAYFVYNSDDPVLRTFQEHRFELLRQQTRSAPLDSAFLAYYTHMPQGSAYARIGELAREVTAGANTQVDKVLALRDYFLSEDEAGNPLFQYTDNPGIPDIPSASKLLYFLFENRKGYCAYYAGATLFLLRSLGIPSRIAVGFMTVDRSDKNPGWYWYYADQAHAWVQVYFPGFGWLDFDTTVGNDEGRESPQPDGTPPLPPPRAWFVAHGKLDEIDTTNKVIQIELESIIHHDREFKDGLPSSLRLDISQARIRLDSVDIPRDSLLSLRSAKAIGINYREAMKRIRPRPREGAEALLRRLPSPVAVDELYVQRVDTSIDLPEPPPPSREVPAPKPPFGRLILGSLLGLLVLFFLLPRLVMTYVQIRRKGAGSSRQKAYWAYREIHLRLRIQGIYRGTQTPLRWAEELESRYALGLPGFMNLYLKQKYSDQPLKAEEEAFLEQYIPRFRRALATAFSAWDRFRAYWRPWRLWARGNRDTRERADSEQEDQNAERGPNNYNNNGKA